MAAQSSIRILNDEDVRHALSCKLAIKVNEQAFKHHASFTIPQRLLVDLPDRGGCTLFKPGFMHGSEYGLGLKVVSVRPRNADKKIATVPATILLFQEETGLPCCLMNATYLTALRTGAGSAVAASRLSAADASHVVVFGAGLQAEAHILCLLEVRPIDTVFIVNRNESAAIQLAKKLEGAKLSANTSIAHGARPFHISALALSHKSEIATVLKNADIVVTATNSPTPLFDGALLKPGALVIGVGSYTPYCRELDNTVIARSKTIVVDSKDALAAGDFALAGKDGLAVEIAESFVYEMGRLVLHDAAPDSRAGDICLYKSVGTALQELCIRFANVRQDLASAVAVCTEAEKLNLGTVAEL